jgi:hypothetical protein
MKRRVILPLIIFVLAWPAFGVDYAAWVRATDRTANPEIIRLMDEGDFSQTLEAAAALGERSDFYVADIVSAYLTFSHRRRPVESERILLAIVASLFPEDLAPAEKRSRFDVNRAAFLDLIRRTEEFETPALRAWCLRLALIGGDGSQYPILAREFERIISKLKKTRGLLDRSETEEFLVMCDMIEKTNRIEFLSLLVDGARFSNDRLVVERSRAVAQALDTRR